MTSAFAGLRAWWILGTVTAAGAVLAAAGATLLGGCVIGAAFVIAVLLRLTRRDHGRLGALVIRTASLDLWLYTTAAVNIVGATLLVTRQAPLGPFLAAEAVLALWGAVAITQPTLIRRRIRHARTAS